MPISFPSGGAGGGFDAFAQMSITQRDAGSASPNTFSVTGTTTDVLNPPTGYQKVTGFLEEVSVGVNITNGEFVIPQDGYYEVRGWANFRHSVNNSTIGFVFGVTPSGGSLVFSQRPTAAKKPNNNDLGLISGLGIFYATKGTTVAPYFASDTSGTVTIGNSSLIMELKQQVSL